MDFRRKKEQVWRSVADGIEEVAVELRRKTHAQANRIDLGCGQPLIERSVRFGMKWRAGLTAARTQSEE